MRLEQVPAVGRERIVLRLSRATARRVEDLHGLRDGDVLAGPALDGPVVFEENHLRFECDPIRGQKTGFFLDQRENRERVEALAAGCDVVNAFAYTGGFSLYAARGGAKSVLSIDQSGPALDAEASTVTATPGAGLIADGIEQAEVAVRLVDNVGNPIPGARVLLTVVGGQVLHRSER